MAFGVLEDYTLAHVPGTVVLTASSAGGLQGSLKWYTESLRAANSLPRSPDERRGQKDRRYNFGAPAYRQLS